MQVGGEAGVCELRGPVVVVHKVDPARGGVPDLPARGQRTQLLAVHVAQISEKAADRSGRQPTSFTGGPEGGAAEAHKQLGMIVVAQLQV